MREQRFAVLPASLRAYERGTELNEGLANYLQLRASGNAASFSLPAAEFDADNVRDRTYWTGASLALLLDRMSPGWQREMEAGGGLGSLDELLHSKLYFAAVPCTFSDLETASIANKARNDVNELKAKHAKLKSDFVNAKGWRIIVSADPQQPLFPAGFDPRNVTMLDAAEVLHRRWIKLSGDDGSVEVLDHVSVTEAAGNHPLFNGVRRIIVTGIAERPAIKENGGSVLVTAAGIRADFHNALVRSEGQKILIELRTAQHSRAQ